MKVKSPPLLSPPGEIVDAILSPSELNQLVEDKKEVHGSRVAKIHFILRTLGHPVEVTEEDKKKMKILESIVDVPSSSMFKADMICQVQEIDYPVDKQREAEKIRNKLPEKENYEAYHIGYMHLALKKLGQPQPLTEEDKEKLLKELDEARNKKDGQSYGTMHYLMKELEIPHEVTRKDITMLKKEIQRLRQEGNTQELGFVLATTTDIQYNPVKKENPQMPPLKEVRQ